MYLGVTVRGSIRRGFKSMGDRMKEASRVIGMIENATRMAGSRYVIGMEDNWKGKVVI